MGKLTTKTSEMLIKEAKKDLGYYHINLRKYGVTVTQDDDDITATVIFTSKVSGRSIYVDCHFNDTEVLQSEIYL